MLLLRALLAYARSAGIDVAALQHELELTPALLEDADGRVDESVLHRAWAHIAATSGDSALGIHAVQHTRLGDYDVLDYAVAFSGTLREAVERIVRFQRLLSDAGALELRSHSDATEIVHPARGSSAEEQDAWLVGILSRLRLASGLELAPRQVYFDHSERAASGCTCNTAHPPDAEGGGAPDACVSAYAAAPPGGRRHHA